MRLPAGLRLYRALVPVFARLLRPRQLARFGARVGERYGDSALSRPSGPLLWVHAASVGETRAALELIRLALTWKPGLSIVLTTVTPDAARIAAPCLTPAVVHQFAPVDTLPAVERFLAHWRPDAAVFLESELWPNMLMCAQSLGIPLALVNARLSERSLRRWSHLPQSFARLIAAFGLILCHDERTRTALLTLAPEPGRLQSCPDLRSSAPALPCDKDALRAVQSRIGARPVWVAASTHVGEDRPCLAAHRTLLRTTPRALLILVPRHPRRGVALEAEARRLGLSVTRQSANQAPDAQVHIADHLGELGVWYRLAQVAFVGGSLVARGGHNPYEPVRSGVAVLHGPGTSNFRDIYRRLDAVGAAVEVTDAETLASAVARLFSQPAERTRRMTRALQIVDDSAREVSRRIPELLAALMTDLPRADCDGAPRIRPL